MKRKQELEIINEFIKYMDKDPSDKNVKILVERWKEHLNEHYYECTDVFLLQLSDLYVNEEYINNIDKYSNGLAAFMSKAIKEYCKGK